MIIGARVSDVFWERSVSGMNDGEGVCWFEGVRFNKFEPFTLRVHSRYKLEVIFWYV